MVNPYEEYENFNTRLKVETNVQGEVIDHREGFSQKEYFRNMQNQPEPEVKEEPAKGFPPMKGVVRAPRKKTKAEQKLEEANKKDLKTRNIKQ